jgi:peptidoglycan hydrolase CwlO-like protein/surface antigen
MINLHKLQTKMQKTAKITIRQRITSLFMTGLLIAGFISAPLVQADRFDDQINAINQQNAQAQTSLNQLSAQATSLADAIAKLQERINALQAQINANIAARDDLNRQIAEAEAELERQKSLLAENIKAMYLEGEISTVEMLFSSKDLSEFVDKEQYRTTVKNKIKSTLDRINALKAQLASQKEQVEKLLADQQRMQGELGAQQGEQQRLLSMNQAQQNELDQMIRNNNSQISQIRAQQAAAYAAATNGGRNNFGSLGNFRFRSLSAQQYCGGGYSYCWAYHDQWVSDSWGLMLARECVHYAADRAARGMNLAPYLGGGRGNAYQWPSSLSGAFRVDRSPEAGAVAIVGAGDLPDYGHAMYVEYVLGDGWVGVSQMNFDGRGSYSTMEVNASSLWFIHFR